MTVWGRSFLCESQRRADSGQVLIVERCPYCRGEAAHLHRAEPDETAIRRMAGCKGGWYTVRALPGVRTG